MAKELVAMGIVGAYPPIPLEEAEKVRDIELLKLAKTFAEEMQRQGNSYQPVEEVCSLTLPVQAAWR